MAVIENNGYSSKVEGSLIQSFGKITIPSKKTIELTKISDIPGIAKLIRTLKYGPLLKINETYITTQFRAGYHGKDAHYVESLFIQFGKDQTYEKMNELFIDKPNDDKATSRGLVSLIQQVDLKNERVFLNTDRMIDATSTPQMKISKAIFQIDNTIKKTQSSIYPYLSMKGVTQAKVQPSISKKIQEDVQAFSTSLNGVAESGLANRILAIWFLAESFRYPPMLFYSLLILHCYLNGYVSLDDLKKGFHPSQKTGSQQIQFFSYAIGSGYELGALNANSSLDDIKTFQEANHNVLKLLYNKIGEQLTKKGYDGDELMERNRILFNLHVRYYLKLCGVNQNQIIDFEWGSASSLSTAYGL